MSDETNQDTDAGSIASIEAALEDYRNGKMLILTDDEDRENEGDLVFAASFATPDKINFMARFGRGLICVAAPEERLRDLGLNPLKVNNTSRFGTNFYEPVDAAEGTTTEIGRASWRERV